MEMPAEVPCPEQNTMEINGTRESQPPPAALGVEMTPIHENSQARAVSPCDNATEGLSAGVVTGDR